MSWLSAHRIAAHKISASRLGMPRIGQKGSKIGHPHPFSHISSISLEVNAFLTGGAMYVYVTRNIVARLRRNDGTDRGNFPLNPGRYQANKTNDGALEILQDAGEPVYLLPFIWWERMELGDILIAA